MLTATLYKVGGPESLILEQRPIPTPLENEVLIRVRAFGLNRSELMTRKGLSPNVVLPRVLGIECVGEVITDPSGEWQQGQQIAAFMGGMGRDFDGSYTQYAALPKSIMMSFSSHLSWQQLGALPEMFQTVYGSLMIALKLQSAESLLIRGGSASIGLFAAQYAALHHAEIIVTTRDRSKVQALIQNGADKVIIDDESFLEQLKRYRPDGVDKALELVGTDTLISTLQTVKIGGSVCMTGMLSEHWAIQNFAPMDIIPSAVNLTVYDSGSIRADNHAFIQTISKVESGELTLPIGRIFRLNEIIEAHHLMESNQANGKIVVMP
jgi:NADPH:quinone reductase-like Zn-dependent oxidoreductase